ncbi:MAG: sulfatase-like hydrolase/transferase [Proteobacteria bacterium]|nr:sulfatase-like hydrolase/transferase [Pseudomonadota bacterium]MBU4471351.1 sulfatase-like hydrolase/transferase [Pseudomonadota bacterium]MCG2751646.1 sulfatase-like hydrolase/transferase [Desulfobacteraceae bacterium]
MNKKRPHILIFNPDQMRADSLHHLGNEASVTPNLDQLAKEGVSFSHAFCQNPVCTPSRCSFMSGWYPHVRGHRTMTHMMRKDEPVLLKELKDAGYYVWMNQRNDLLPAQKESPFEAYSSEAFTPDNASLKRPGKKNSRGKPGTDTYYSFYGGKLENAEAGKHPDMDSAWVEGAIDMIHRRPEDQPLCIFLPLQYPHPPYQVEEPYFSMIDRGALKTRIKAPENWEKKPSILKGIHKLQAMQNWSEPRWDELRATYLGMCTRVDRQFGEVINALKQEGIYDDTAIFVFSDHGDFTGDYGLVEKTQNTFEDCLTHVPFLIKPPKEVAVMPGIKDALVELIDFYATAVDFCGLKETHTHFGKTLRGVISGEKATHRDAVFCEGGRLQQERHCTETDDAEGLNEKGEYYPRQKMQSSHGPEHTKATMCRTQEFKYVRRLYEKDELYDLKNDPEERFNCIDDPALVHVVADFKERTLTWYQETCDVVPFEPDDRFTDEALLNMIKLTTSEQTFNMIASTLANGTSLKDILKMRGA